MSVDMRAYDNEHGDPVVVLVTTGTYDVSRLVGLLSSGRCEDHDLAKRVRAAVKRHNGGRAALRLLRDHGGADFTDPAPEYLCRCDQTFPSHLARAAHAATCSAIVCQDIFPPHLNPPPGPPSLPRRCALPAGHVGDHCADRIPERLSVTWDAVTTSGPDTAPDPTVARGDYPAGSS